jgi:hypothetical protein
MNALAQNIAVALLIVASAAYAVWALAPRTLRLSLAQLVERITHGRLLASKLIKNAPGCSSCDTCATDKPAAQVVELHARKNP